MFAFGRNTEGGLKAEEEGASGVLAAALEFEALAEVPLLVAA